MKKMLRIFSFSLAFILFFVFSGQGQTWSNWENSSCYKGIDFRYYFSERVHNGKKRLVVVFRNRYKERAHFSFEIQNNVTGREETSGRTHLEPGEVEEGGEWSGHFTWVAVEYTNNLGIVVRDMRFDKDNWGEDYYTCDNN